MGEGALGAELLQVFGPFGLGLSLGSAHPGRQSLEEQDVFRAASVADSLALDVGDDAGGAGQAPPRVDDEDALRVFGGEAAAAGGRAGLKEQGRALGRRLGQMRTGYIEVLPHMVDGVDLGRVGVDAAFGIAQHGVVLPTALPQLVDHLEILIGQVVPLLMRRQAAQAEVESGVGQIRCHDVPGDPPASQMVQGRHLPREGKRMGLQDRTGVGKAQVLGGVGHGWHQEGRVVDRGLHPLDDGRLWPAAVGVVDPDHIGQK